MYIHFSVGTLIMVLFYHNGNPVGGDLEDTPSTSNASLKRNNQIHGYEYNSHPISGITEAFLESVWPYSNLLCAVKPGSFGKGEYQFWFICDAELVELATSLTDPWRSTVAIMTSIYQIGNKQL